MRMTGYLQIGSGYIAVENILTLSDFLSKITGGSKRVLTNRQVAMMCFLKNHVIRPSNCEEIAKEWGSNSPMAIYNEYTKISRLYSKDITLSVKVAKAYTSDLRVLINTPGLGLSAKKVSEFASIYRLYL